MQLQMTIAQMLYSFRLWRIIIYFYHHPCLENKNKAVCIGKNRECRNRVFYSSGARPWTPHANRCKLPAVRQRMGSGARMPGRNGTGQVALWKVGIQGSKWWNAVGLLTKVFETEKCIAPFGWYTFLFYLFQQVLVRILGPLTLLQVNSTNRLLQF